MQSPHATFHVLAFLMLGHVLSTSAQTRAETIWFVNDDAAGANDGTSWTDAFVDLQGALSVAVAGDEVWVAAGSYVPTLETEPGNPRTVTFDLPTGVALYGGFAGTETNREQRDFESNTTVLSGDLSGDDGPDFANTEENAYHVVMSLGNDDATVLNGFTVRAGRADGLFNWPPPGTHNNGSAVLIYQGTPQLAYCTFEGNWSESRGAVNARGGARISDCTFRNNVAKYGGGLWIGYVDTEVIRCRFLNNVASNGGGLAHEGSASSTISDCEFTGNTALGDDNENLLGEGGGMSCNGGRTKVFNCTFDSNNARTGGGLYSNHRTDMTLSDSTFIGNMAESGGGLTLYSGIVSRCRVIGNVAEEGGGLLSRGSVVVSSSQFSANSATDRGGGVYASRTPMTLANCTIAGNSSGIYVVDGVNMTNSIVWGNGAPGSQDQAAQVDSFYFVPVVNHTCVQGLTAGLGGTGNTNQDPQFVDPGTWNGTVWIDGDYHLTANSPMIDAGDNAPSRTLGNTDLDGFPRFVDQLGVPDSGRGRSPIVDMGAYEYIVDCNANGLDDGMDIQTGVSTDCGGNGIPDECEDCNDSGLEDACDIDSDPSLDCDGNGVPDECDLRDHVSRDCNFNGVPDRCDIASATSLDCDANGVPDECDAAMGNDCDGNGAIDRCEWDGYVGTFTFPGTGVFGFSKDSNDYAVLDVAFDAQDNVLLAGRYRGTVDLDPTAGVDERTSSSWSAFVTKLWSDDSYAWTATFESVVDLGVWDVIAAEAITSDPEGNIFAAGVFFDIVDFDPTSGEDLRTAIGGSDIFTVALAPDGTYRWGATFGGPDSDYAPGVAVDPEGAVFVSGSFEETVDFDPTAGVDNRTSNGDGDVFITKLGADGSYRWTATVGGRRSEQSGGLVSDDQGSVILTGSFSLTVDFDPTSGVDNHIAPDHADYLFVTKLNGDGSYGWTTTFESLGGMHGEAVAVDSLGNILVAGSFEGTTDFDPGESEDLRSSAGSTDVFGLKLGPDGSYDWAVTFGGVSYDKANDVSVDSQDNILFAGYYRDTVDFDPSAAADVRTVNGQGGFISKYDSNRLYAWTANVQAPSTEYGVTNAIALDIDSRGIVMLVGDFNATVEFDPGAGTDERDTEDQSAFVTRIADLPGRCCQAVYGDLDETGAVDLSDILCVLDGFAGEFGNCPAERVDVAPCEHDGVIDLSDILAVLDAFAGTALCDPCVLP